MTAAERVARARRILSAAAVAEAGLWGAAAFVVVGALRAPVAVGLAAAVAVAAAVLWRGRAVWSFRRVALWLEERHPELRYALVTAVDPTVPAADRAPLDRVSAGVATGPALRARLRRTLSPAALALALALAAAVLVPGSLAPIGGAARGGRAAVRPAAARLAPLGAELVPPPYAGRARRRLDDPSTLDGLPGTRVTLDGPGSPDGLLVSLDSAALSVRARGRGGWRVAFALPDSAAALRVSDARAGRTRLVVVAPVPDAPPVVRLLLPARDSTVRAPDARVVLEAELADDVGLGAARFELIVSAGESEGSFVSRESVAGARSLGGARTGRLQLSTTLAALGVAAGGQLAVRAMATDRNDVGGPGTGYSETRIIRVARAGEYDSLVAADLAVPPPVGEGIVTLSMIVDRTERLHRARASIAAAELRRRAGALAGDGEEVERRLQEVIATQTGEEPGAHVHDESERTAEDPRLREAAQALRDGLTELRVARTGAALPHLYRAKRALDAYRLAARYYIRGRVRETVVNTELVRLAGRDTGRAAPLVPRAPVAERAGMRAAYVAALRELPARPERAAELLTLARVEALRADTSLARALGDAVDALRARRDASAALARARRVLFGVPAAHDSLATWSLP